MHLRKACDHNPLAVNSCLDLLPYQAAHIPAMHSRQIQKFQARIFSKCMY